MNISCNWKPIIDKFHIRLSSWKARSLSFGGRLTLLRFVLGALGTYYFSLFKAPKCVISYLEKLRCNFFWGGSVDNNKLAWVAWKQVCSSKDCGGCGIGSLLASNLAMFTKWWWRMYALEAHKECLISERCVSGGLIDLSSHVWAWRRSPRDGWDAAYQYTIKDDLCGILIFGPAKIKTDGKTVYLAGVMRVDMSIMQKEIGAPLQPETPRMKSRHRKNCMILPSISVPEHDVLKLLEESGIRNSFRSLNFEQL
nr:RNA-directed DNA polymerase, eukaryota, reverse transcriptase zinc-binding domain protein [Tanacetum cinerariifolium]